MNSYNGKSRKNERGSALVYILIAIALLAALTVSFMEPSSQQGTNQDAFRSAAALQGQINTIRSAVQECVLRYSNGDQAIPTGVGQDDEGANKIYPIRPDSSYLDAPDGNRQVRNIRCPGNNTGTADDHVDIFSGATGKFLNAPPDLFEEWQWYNGNDGVFFWIRTTNSDSFLRTSLEKLDDNFSECETDVVASGGSAVDLDVDGTVNCPANNTCFRVWMINPATAPHGDFAVDNSCGSSDI